MINNDLKSDIGISVVIPFYNEADGIIHCCKALDEYCERVSFPIEFVFVDDGSIDNSADEVSKYRFTYVKKVRLIKLSKNCGSQIAIRAGIKASEFEICTWVGADLQDPLELIEEGRARILDGYDIVCIEKKSNKVPLFSRMFSSIYSKMIKRYAVNSYTSFGIDSVVFSGRIKDNLNRNIEANSEIVLQILNMGFDVSILSLDFNEREYGVSKWTLSKKIKLFIDSFVSYSYAPIRLVSIMGIVLMAFGLLVGLVTVVSRIVNAGVPEGYSTIVSLIAIGFGVTNISIGIVAEYLWRTLDVARNRPCYYIKENRELL